MNHNKEFKIPYTPLVGRSSNEDPLAESAIGPLAVEEELPEIPYTPLMGRNSNEDPVASSAMPPPAPKRTKAAERKARSRAAQSAKKRDEDLARNRTEKAKQRSAQSANEREEDLARNRTEKAKQRSAQSANEREEDLAKNRTEKANQRAAQSTDEREAANRRACEGMAKKRNQDRNQVKTEEAMKTKEILEASHEVPELKDTPDNISLPMSPSALMEFKAAERKARKAKAAERKARSRANLTKPDIEFDNISNKHQMRKARKERTGKDHLVQNLKAKRGMRMLKEEGWLMDFATRSAGKREEKSDWEKFNNKSKEHSQKLKSRKPDIVEQINERNRQRLEERREEERKSREKDREGQWYCNPQNEEWYWTGEGEPEFDMDDGVVYEAPEERSKQEREEEDRNWRLYFEGLRKEEKEIQKEKRHQKEQERKEAMKIPVKPPPAQDLCEYEKLREKNIKERVEAMEACGFFGDLHELKKEIGLIKKK